MSAEWLRQVIAETIGDKRGKSAKDDRKDELLDRIKKEEEYCSTNVYSIGKHSNKLLIHLEVSDEDS